MIPPTLKEISVDGLEPNPITLKINAKGEQVPFGCKSDSALNDQTIALWPNSVEPWIPAFRRRALQIPPTASECEAAQWVTPPIKINGLSDNQTLLLKGDRIIIELRSSGGLGDRDWYLNGEFITSSNSDQAISLTLNQLNTYELIVVDEYNHLAKVVFDVIKTP
jgi:penicillin-binding protein 1C